MEYRNQITCAIAICMSGLTGCANLDKGLDGVSTLRIEIPLNNNVGSTLSSCEGLVFERHSYSNGTGIIKDTNVSKRSNKLSKVSNFESYEITPDIRKYYKEQKKSELCWATSLEIAFKYFGYKYNDYEFVNVLSKQCGTSDNEDVTSREMLFSASTRHIGKPNWPDLKNASQFSDESRSYTVNLGFLPHLYYYNNNGYSSTSYDSRTYNAKTFKRTYYNAYSEVRWVRKSDRTQYAGGILFLGNTGSMVYHLLNNRPLLIGIREKAGGHVVIAFGADYRLGGVDKRWQGGKLTLDHNTKIENFYILDPADGENPFYTRGGELLNHIDFVYAMDIL